LIKAAMEKTASVFASIYFECAAAYPTLGTIVVGLQHRVCRPLQRYDITPHYYNRPDMDALETVLELIREGSY